MLTLFISLLILSGIAALLALFLEIADSYLAGDSPGGRVHLQHHQVPPAQQRTPEADEIVSCQPFLLEQLRAIGPQFICAPGGPAAQTLLRTKEPISRLRGKFYDYHGIPLLPTFHPAFLLRNPNEKKTVWEDMKLLLRHMRQA